MISRFQDRFEKEIIAFEQRQDEFDRKSQEFRTAAKTYVSHEQIAEWTKVVEDSDADGPHFKKLYSEYLSERDWCVQARKFLRGGGQGMAMFKDGFDEIDEIKEEVTTADTGEKKYPNLSKYLLGATFLAAVAIYLCR